jgi:hypothetical protein
MPFPALSTVGHCSHCALCLSVCLHLVFGFLEFSPVLLGQGIAAIAPGLLMWFPRRGVALPVWRPVSHFFHQSANRHLPLTSCSFRFDIILIVSPVACSLNFAVLSWNRASNIIYGRHFLIPQFLKVLFICIVFAIRVWCDSRVSARGLLLSRSRSRSRSCSVLLLHFGACVGMSCWRGLSSVHVHINVNIWIAERVSRSPVLQSLLLWETLPSKLGKYYVRFEVFTAVTMKNCFFCDVAPCGSCKKSSQRASVATYS